MHDKPLSRLGVSAITVSVEISDKSYGSGISRFMAVGSRLPDSADGLQLTSDDVIDDGLQKYFTAWQTIAQAMLASNEIEADEWKEQTRKFLSRIQKVRKLYAQLVKA